MKKLIITAAALMFAAASYGQGTFLVNFKDSVNNVKFVDPSGAGISGSTWFVQVLAGANASSLTPIASADGVPFALTRTGSVAGYPNPILDNFTVAGAPGGTSETVGLVAYEGSSYASATVKSTPITATVNLTEPPATPAEVVFGTQTVTVGVPEPATLALGALGAGALLLIRRRK